MELISHRFNLASAAALGCAVALLAACDGKSDKAGAPVGQTIARVNGQEITVHELIRELDKLDSRSDPDTDTRTALHALVKRSLLAQKATEAKLHRSPSVMMALRRARMDVLAQAYLAHRVANDAVVSDQDVQRYMDKNPRHFKQREYLVLDQVVVKRTLLTDKEMRALKSLKTPELVMERLSSMRVPYERRQISFFSMDFPNDMLEGIDKLAPNRLFVIRTPNRVAISKIVDRGRQPLTGRKAFEEAKRRLAIEKGNAAALQTINSLMESANIKYFGEYEAMAAAGPAAKKKNALSAGAKPAKAVRPGKTNSVEPAKPGHGKAN